jgi:hypothetical protein
MNLHVSQIFYVVMMTNQCFFNKGLQNPASTSEMYTTNYYIAFLEKRNCTKVLKRWKD